MGNGPGEGALVIGGGTGGLAVAVALASHLRTAILDSKRQRFRPEPAVL